MAVSKKEWLKQTLPAPMVAAINRVHHWFWRLQRPQARRLHTEITRMRAQFDELNRNAPPATLVMRKGVEIKTPERDDPTLISFAWGTPRCVYELDHFLAEANNKKCLWDVGAFHGVYSLSFCAADPSRQSLAFEPSPLGFEKLQANVKANPNLQIRPFCAAIGDRCGELAMSYEWQHLVADPNADVPAKESGDKAMKVPLLTIDRIYEEQGIAPDIVKIDVEGFEYHVIQGAARTLKAVRPVICMEAHQSMLARHGISLSQLWDALRGLNYQIWRMDGRELSLLPLNPPDAFAENIICRPM